MTDDNLDSWLDSRLTVKCTSIRLGRNALTFALRNQKPGYGGRPRYV